MPNKKAKVTGSYRFKKRQRQRQNSSQSKQNDVNNDIIKQLEIQRARQKEIQIKKISGESNISAPKANLGDFEYNDKRKAYFPKGSIQKLDELVSSDTDKRNKFNAYRKENICKSIVASQGKRLLFQRNHLRVSGLQCSLMSRAKVVFNSRQLGNKQVSFIPPMMSLMDNMYHDNHSSYLDCLCKEHILHPSARSFDVLLQRSYCSSTHECYQLPHLVTIVGETSNNICLRPQQKLKDFDLSSPSSSGFESILFNLPHEPDTFYKSVRYSADHMSIEDKKEFQLGILAGESNNTRSSFYIVKGSSDGLKTCSWSEMEIPKDVNDFCFIGNLKDKVALAASSKSKSIGLVHIDHSGSDCVAHFRKEKNLSSDVMCIESIQVDNLALHGHRNGKISLIDYRDPTFISLRIGNENDNGYVSSILPLSNLSFVCRSSFGECYLHDLRLLSCTPMHGNKIKRSSVLLHMGHSLDNKSYVHRKNDMRTSLCSGLASDPHEKIIFSPFVTNGNDAHIAAWSLTSGSLISTLDVSKGMCSNGMTKHFIELNPTRTSAYRWNDVKLNKYEALSGDPNSFGLWFKTNYMSQSHNEALLKNAGGIHHITIPGSLDSDIHGRKFNINEFSLDFISGDLDYDLDRLERLHNNGLL